MSALDALARLLGVRPDLAEDVLHSERAARAVLTRRSLFAAAGAMAPSAAFSFPTPGRWIYYVPVVGEIISVTVTIDGVSRKFHNMLVERIDDDGVVCVAKYSAFRTLEG